MAQVKYKLVQRVVYLLRRYKWKSEKWGKIFMYGANGRLITRFNLLEENEYSFVQDR